MYVTELPRINEAREIQMTPSIYATEFDIVSATVSSKIDVNAA